jgi:hypothetical protein
MSICVDYFFNHEDELPALTRKINGWLGCCLAPYEGNPQDLFSRFLGMELNLGRHSLENDRDLNFADYTYCLGIRTPIPDADLRRMQIPATVLIAQALFIQIALKGMLVYDVQHLLARYEGRLDVKGSGTEEMFDVVSGEFVALPRHLDVLINRLRKMSYKAQFEQ